ncbi:Rv1733c family protein [Streptomyces sp. NPDC001514]
MRAITGLRRWRHNPLRRATDLVEAWAALAAVLLLTVAVPAVGWLCGGLADAALRESVRAQRAERHATTARVLRPAPKPQQAVADPEAGFERRSSRVVVAEWTGADGSRHTGTMATGIRTSDPGDTFRIWTDDEGNAVTRPMDAETARAHAVLAGLGAAAVAAAVVEGGRRLFVWRLIQRRYAHLDRAWAKAGPDWGRTGTGS